MLAKLLCVFQLSKEFLSAFVYKIISYLKSINYDHEIGEILIFCDRGMMEASLFCRQMQTKKIWLFQNYFYRKHTNRLTRRMSVCASPDNSCINPLTLKCRGKRALNDVKMVLYSEQFVHDVMIQIYFTRN